MEVLIVTMLWLVAILLVCSVFVIHRGNLFSPHCLFFGLFGMFWISRGIFLYINDLIIFDGLVVAERIGEWHYIHVTCVAVSGLMVYLLGMRFAQGRGRIAVSTHGRQVPASTLSFIFALICVAGIAMLFLQYVSSSGGIFSYIQNWGRVRYEVGGGDTFRKYLFEMLSVFSWYCYYYGSETRQHLAIVLSYALVGLTVIVCLVLGGRSPLLIFLFGLIAIHYSLGRQFRIGTILAALAAIISGGIALRNIRYFLVHEELSVWGSELTFRAAFAQFTRDFTPVDYSYLLFDVVPKYQKYLLGDSLLDIPLLLVPRFLWEGKPLALGSAQALENLLPQILRSHSHLAPSFIGDLYLNFSYFGVYIGLFALGFSYERLRQLIVSMAPMGQGFLTGIAFAFTFWLYKVGFYGSISRILIIYCIPTALLLVMHNISFQKEKDVRNANYSPTSL